MEVPTAPPEESSAKRTPPPSEALPRRRVAGMLGLYLERGQSAQPGVRIVRVMPGFPAERAGLTSGQRVLAIGRTRVDTYREIVRVLARHQAGDVVTLRVGTGHGRELSVELRLDPAPASP